ncbi:hypothetical protein SGLAM104S_10290 [Streptomyces glaucescens]
MATSGWLISRASQQPPVLYLMVAVTATRAFGIGRAVFRYAERLVSHDAVLRMLADTRVAVYRRLERLAPAGLRTTRRGDLLSRLVADVDALQDYWLRWLLPRRGRRRRSPRYPSVSRPGCCPRPGPSSPPACRPPAPESR